VTQLTTSGGSGTTSSPASAEEVTAAPRSATPSLGTRIWRERYAYLMVVPGLVYFLLFHYLPLAGIVIAFQDYSPFLGFAGSRWVGFDNFLAFASDVDFAATIANTLVISGLQLLLAFPLPIALAVLLNSLLSERVKRLVQSVVYLPHFLSWVIVISVWQQVLGGAGAVSQALQAAGMDPLTVMSDPSTFKFLVTAQVIWKDTGWGTIIFFAAISGISSELYESAACDGASAWRQIWHVTLPALVPVISLLAILRLGDVLTVGFEQLLLQQPSVGAEAAQVLDTFTYFRGVRGNDWGIGAAAGLLKGIVGTALVLGANRIARRFELGGIL